MGGFLTGRTSLTTVQTADIANDAVTGAKLNPALVGGDLIYADGTDTINRLAKGSANQTLQMNAGATAPNWVTVAAASSDFVKIVSTTASAASSIEFTSSHFDNSTYKSYQFFLEHVNGSVDGNPIYMHFSTDGGSSFIDSGFKYEGAYMGLDEIDQDRNRLLPSNDEHRLTHNSGVGNASGEDVSGIIYIINPGATKRTRVLTWTTYHDSSGYNGFFIGGSSGKDNEDTDGLRLQMNSGTITGTITMYGIK